MQFKDFWLNDAENPSDKRAFNTLGASYRVTEALGGGVEHGYASGRSRLYSTEDDVTTVDLQLRDLPLADIAWLRSKRGRPLCARDPKGRKVFCSFHEPVTEVSTGPVDDADDVVNLVLTSTTWDESV